MLFRSAVTHAGLDTNPLRPVGLASLQAGITLTRWFAGEVRRVYSILSEDEEDRDTRHLLEWVRGQGGQVTARKLRRSNSRKYRCPEDAVAALQSLVDGGMAEWIDQPSGPAGGRPTRYARLRVDVTCTDDDIDPSLPLSDETTKPPLPPIATEPDHESLSDITDTTDETDTTDGWR